MPKLKSKRGAAKRFVQSGSGRLKRRAAFRNHILTKKSTKRKRQLRVNPVVKECDSYSIERMLALK